MQNKGMTDIVTDKKQGKLDAEFSFYLDSSLKKKNIYLNIVNWLLIISLLGSKTPVRDRLATSKMGSRANMQVAGNPLVLQLETQPAKSWA